MANIFGPGISGGLLAAAGAAQGLGQGITQVGEQGQKEQLAEKMNDLAEKREETITRLQGQQQSALEEQRAGHENERTQKEIAGRSAVTQYERGSVEAEAAKQREFQGKQTQAELASKEKIATGHDTARVTASGLAHPLRPVKDPASIWTVHTIKSTQMDPVTKMQVPGPDRLVITNGGRTFAQVGDKFVPYDASTDKTTNPASLARPPADAVNDLVNDPFGKAPNGQMKSDQFVQKYGHLPMAWFSAAQNAKPATQPPPPGLGKSLVPPGSTVDTRTFGAPAPAYGEDEGTQQDQQDDNE
jgi:hypothetical protein